MVDYQTIIYALLSGVLPALIWLIFRLREDYKHPEPRGMIGRTFLIGMGAVIIALPFQKMVDTFIPGMALTALVLWVVIEEVLKLGAGYIGGLRSAYDNEPIDPIIYMITAALGFVALENTLFILGPLLGEDLGRSLITGNLRFIGASLLHVASSGIIGVGLAFSFYKRKVRRLAITILSLVVAITFHAGFNLAIINWGNTGVTVAFVSVWVGVILLLLAFERAKSIAR